MAGFDTCADAAEQSATFLAQYNAVVKVRPPTEEERAAAKRARSLMACYGLPIPEGLK